MTISIQAEKLSDILDEMKVVFPIHWEELALNKDKVPLDPQYDIYLAREERDELILVTVRQEGGLIGYFVGFIAPGLHYKTCLTCTMDIFYIHPDYRGSDLGFRMFNYVERELRARGVQRWFMGSKLHKDASFLFDKIGAEPCETYHSKWLGE